MDQDQERKQALERAEQLHRRAHAMLGAGEVVTPTGAARCSLQADINGWLSDMVRLGLLPGWDPPRLTRP